MIRSRRGQATTEMVFVLPLLMMLAGAAMFIAYACWQGIKVQQAANMAARIQGQERVGGGTSVGAIDQENGNLTASGDPDPAQEDAGLITLNRFDSPANGAPDQNSVYGRFHRIVKQMFKGNEQQVYVPPPQVGQNIDQVKVVRVINLPKIPFFKWGEGKEQIKLQATAWGGEDTYMYGLPRWGKTKTTDSEWRRLVKDAGN